MNRDPIGHNDDMTTNTITENVRDYFTVSSDTTHLINGTPRNVELAAVTTHQGNVRIIIEQVEARGESQMITLTPDTARALAGWLIANT